MVFKWVTTKLKSPKHWSSQTMGIYCPSIQWYCLPQMTGISAHLCRVKPSPDFSGHGHGICICKYIQYNSLVEGSTQASSDAQGVPALWASTNWHMPLDTHQHLCCANSQTAMPHHVSSRTHPPHLRTPAEHPTRSYLPAEGQEHTWMHFITCITCLPASYARCKLQWWCCWGYAFPGMSTCHCVTGLVLLQCFHLQELKGTRNLLPHVLDSPKIITVGPPDLCIRKH